MPVPYPAGAGNELRMTATLEVPSPVGPDQPLPAPGGPETPDQNPPEGPITPDPPAPDAPQTDPKGPETPPDSPPG